MRVAGALALVLVACAKPGGSAHPLIDAAARIEEPGAESRFRELTEFQSARLALGILLAERVELPEAKTCLEDAGPLGRFDLGSTLAAMGALDQAAVVFGNLDDADALPEWNRAALLRDRGEETAPLFREIASTLGPHDELWPFLLDVLAEEEAEAGDYAQADALYAEADYRRGM